RRRQSGRRRRHRHVHGFLRRDGLVRKRGAHADAHGRGAGARGRRRRRRRRRRACGPPCARSGTRRSPRVPTSASQHFDDTGALMLQRNLIRPATIALLASVSAGAAASELSYTYVDFRVLSTSVDATGMQSTTPGQDVTANAGEGDGISVAGAVALPNRFYLVGAFSSSIIDVTAHIESPLAAVDIDDEFDLITSRFGLGYQRELAPNFDLTLEVTYDTGEL